MSYAVKVENLKKSYGDHTVLKGLSFHVKKGEVFALLGGNGAGKTTTLECVEGLRRYDSGAIAVNGRVGIQLQSSSLPAHIRPLEAVRLFAEWNRVKADTATLAALGINSFAKKQYLELSTGQKRRLHLALALLGDPELLFLDEPTAGLDVEGRVSLHSQIRRLKAEGKTILLASHDMAEVESLCDRLAILKDGSLVFCGTAAELTAKSGSRYTISIKTEQGDESFFADNIADAMLDLLEGYRQKGIAVLDIKTDRGTLEQHFMELTGREQQ